MDADSPRNAFKGKPVATLAVWQDFARLHAWHFEVASFRQLTAKEEGE